MVHIPEPVKLFKSSNIVADCNSGVKWKTNDRTVACCLLLFHFKTCLSLCSSSLWWLSPADKNANTNTLKRLLWKNNLSEGLVLTKLHTIHHIWHGLNTLLLCVLSICSGWLFWALIFIISHPILTYHSFTSKLQPGNRISFKTSCCKVRPYFPPC